MSEPLVTIVALNYNQDRYLLETLESIKEQTYKKIQLIIADDASTDGSVEIINNWIKMNWPDAIRIFNEENKGITKTLNKCLAHAMGKYLHVIACDDVLLPDKTEKMVQSLESVGEEYALIYSDMCVINDIGEQLSTSLLRDINYNPGNMPEGNVFMQELKANFIMAPTAMIKLKSLLDVGKYDENLPFEDYDLFLRISRKYKIKFLKGQPSVKYRRLNTSMSRKLGNKVHESNLYSYYKLLVMESDEIYKREIVKAILAATKKLYNIPFSKRLYYQKKALTLKFDFLLFSRYLALLFGIKKTHEFFHKYKKKVIRKIKKPK